MLEEQVNADFERARHKAFLRELRSILRREPNRLIPFHEVRSRMAPEGESYRGLQTVPLEKIVGSVDRFRDFDRAFLPRQRHTAKRWKSIDRAYYEDVTLPPVQLYKVGDVYFVKDGNHRVSVARERGVEYIDAEVIEGHIRVPLYASMSPQELLLQVEYAEFLRRTDLDRLRPEHDIRPTALGRYDEMWDHILVHQQWLSERERRDVSLTEAVTSWYDDVYLPIVKAVWRHDLLKRFPGRSEADLYLWVMAHRDLFLGRPSRSVDADAPVAELAEAARQEARLVRRLRRATRKAGRKIKRALQVEPSRPEP